MGEDANGSPLEERGTKCFSEMSVRGLDLLRYAAISSDGTYRCLECERVQITKHFKNKYSFQRHAFLYHEGRERKVFPCPICQKEFSRPDKMKSHLKTAHDCVMPKSASAAADSAAAVAAAAAAAGMDPSSALLFNPLLNLDPTSSEGKIGSLKDSGARAAASNSAAAAAQANSEAHASAAAAILSNPFLNMHHSMAAEAVAAHHAAAAAAAAAAHHAATAGGGDKASKKARRKNP
jgi:hypothetical protein